MNVKTRKKPSHMGPGIGYVSDLLQLCKSPINYTGLANKAKMQDRSRFLKLIRWGLNTGLLNKHDGEYVLTLNGRAFISVLGEYENA